MEQKDLFKFELDEVVIHKDNRQRLVIQSRTNHPHPFDTLNAYGVRPEGIEGPSTDLYWEDDLEKIKKE